MSRFNEYKANMQLADVWRKLSMEERDNVKTLVGKYGWGVRIALQQVFVFGIQANWVYNYHSDTLIESI